MKQYRCYVYANSSIPGCVVVCVRANSKREAKAIAIPIARRDWSEIPASPRVRVMEFGDYSTRDEVEGR